eukprot:717383-Pyramimonas_sp.AAC.1
MDAVHWCRSAKPRHPPSQGSCEVHVTDSDNCQHSLTVRTSANSRTKLRMELTKENLEVLLLDAKSQHGPQWKPDLENEDIDWIPYRRHLSI